LFLIMIVMAVIAVVTGTMAAMSAVDHTGAVVKKLGPGRDHLPLERTWTNPGQENAVGSQVLVNASLASPVSAPGGSNEYVQPPVGQAGV
jgi:hypothetical protein